MDNKRDQWGSKLGFILAAIGSAVGLGNIWRFPYLVYENGGGAFLVPYFFAIFTAGIPLLILEYGMGHKFRGSTPLALARANKKWEWLGWWPSITAFFILGYYSMILSWAMKYFTLSFNKGWGNDTNAYFHNDFLRLTDSPFQFGSVIWSVLIGILLVWGISWFICYRGVKGGIEKLNKILLPTLVAIMVIIAIRGVTLEGATLGLNKLFTPDWSKVMEPKVWIAAYGQVFYSLSLAMGIMMTYSSYLPKKTDINNSAFMTGFANCGFEFLCAIAVFAILGVMATSQGVGIEEVVSSGIGLAFIVFPKVFTVMGTWGTIIGALLSATFATGAGLYILDIMDNFINCYGIVVVGLLEVIVIGWIVKPATIRNHTNKTSYFNIGKWWDFVVKFITPTMLLIMLISNFVAELKAPYGDYNLPELFAYGWSVIGLGIIGALLFSKAPWKNKEIENFNDEEEVA